MHSLAVWLSSHVQLSMLFSATGAPLCTVGVWGNSRPVPSRRVKGAGARNKVKREPLYC